MKKLLVLMLVLGLVSAANAVISLSVNGAPAPPEITINPSDWIILDTTSDTGGATGGYSAYIYVWPMGAPPYSFGGTRVMQGDKSVILGPYPSYYYDYVYFDITIADASGNLVPGTGAEIDFHCDGPGDVLVELVDYSTFQVIQSMIIHQPEPMTIALLGLGGLFLRRRK